MVFNDKNSNVRVDSNGIVSSSYQGKELEKSSGKVFAVHLWRFLVYVAALYMFWVLAVLLLLASGLEERVWLSVLFGVAAGASALVFFKVRPENRWLRWFAVAPSYLTLWGSVLLFCWRWRARRANRRGADFLCSMGRRQREDVSTSPVNIRHEGNKRVISLDKTIDGVSSEEFAKQACEFGSKLGAASVQPVVEYGDFGQVTVTAFKKNPFDLLKSDISGDMGIVDYNPEDVSFNIGYDSFGDFFRVSLKNVPSILITGSTGSGKSRGVLSWFLPSIMTDTSQVSDNPHVKAYFVDGKGSNDLGAFIPSCERFISGIDARDFEKVADFFDDFVREYQEQLARAIALGYQNVWDVPLDVREREGLYFLILICDECHMYLGDWASTKEEKALQARMVKAIATIAKQARSAGGCVCLISQKATTDSVPSAISSNSNSRFCFKQNSQPAILAGLGQLDETDPSPLREKRGICVAVTDTQPATKFKSFYLP